MKWLQLATKQVLRNLQRYGTLFLSQGAIILVVFLFQSISAHPFIAMGIMSKAGLTMGFNTVTVVLLVIGVFFSWYINSFFLRRRAPELGLLTLLGMPRTSLIVWFLVEGLAGAIFALLIGLATGMLFGQLAFMALGRLMQSSSALNFVLVPEAFMAVLGTALLLMTIHVLGGLSLIARTRIISLFKANRSPERPARGNVILGLLGLGSMILSYILSELTTMESFVALALPIVGFAIGGTFLFTRYFLALVLHLLRKRSLERTSAVSLVALAQLSYRLRRNARALSLVAVLAATTITSLGTAIYFYTMVNGPLDDQTPLALMLENPSASQRKDLEARLADDPGLVHASSTQDAVYGSFGGFENYQVFRVLSASEAPGWFALSGRTVELPDPGELVLAYSQGPGEDVAAHKAVTVYHLGSDGKPQKENGKTLSIASQYKGVNNQGKAFGPVLVMNEADQTELLSGGSLGTLELHGYRFSRLETEQKISTWLIAQNLFENQGVGQHEQWWSSRMAEREMTYGLLGIMLFVAAMLGLVLLMACGSIISFKQMMDMEDDASRYHMLWNLGFTRDDMRGVFTLQTGLFFGLPYVVGVVHSYFALSLLGRMLSMPIGWHILAVCLVFGLLFALYFRSVLRSGLRISQTGRNPGFSMA